MLCCVFITTIYYFLLLLIYYYYIIIIIYIYIIIISLEQWNLGRCSMGFYFCDVIVLSSICHREAHFFSSLNGVGVAPNNANSDARPTVHIGGRRMLPCTVCSKQRVHQYTQGSYHKEAFSKRSKQ